MYTFNGFGTDNVDDPGDEQARAVDIRQTTEERIQALEQKVLYLEVAVARLVHALQQAGGKSSDPYAPVIRTGIEL